MADVKKEFNQREDLVSSGQPAGSINFEKQTGRIIVGQDDGNNLEYGIGRVVITSDELTNKKLSEKNINLLFNNHLAQWSAGVVKVYSSLMVFLNLPGTDFIRSLVPVSVTAYSQTQLLLSGTYMNMMSSDLVYQHILVSVQSDGTMQIPNPLTFNDNGDGTKVLADNGQYVNMPATPECSKIWKYNGSQENLAVGASSHAAKGLLRDWNGSDASSKVKDGDMYITTNHHLFLVTNANDSSVSMVVTFIGNMAHFEEGDELVQSSSSVPSTGSVPLATQYADYAVFSYKYNGIQTKTITNFVFYGFFKHRTSKIQYLLVKNLSSSGTLNISPGTGYFCNFETVTLKAKEGVELSIFRDVVLASSVINF